MADQDPYRDLPPDLLAALRQPSVVVAGETAIFDSIAESLDVDADTGGAMSDDCGCGVAFRLPKLNGTCANCGGWLPGERPPSLVAMWRGPGETTRDRGGPMSDERMEQRVVRAKGMCGGLNADGSSICIRNPGHTGDCFPSEEIERASAVLVGHPGLQAWEPVILARAILDASGLIAERDEWQARAEKAEAVRLALLARAEMAETELNEYAQDAATDAVEIDRLQEQVEQLKRELASIRLCPSCDHGVVLGVGMRQVSETGEPEPVQTEEPCPDCNGAGFYHAAAEQVEQARELIGNLRTASREVGEFFDFKQGRVSRFDWQEIDVDAETALLSLHDYANDAERFLAETEPVASASGSPDTETTE